MPIALAVLALLVGVLAWRPWAKDSTPNNVRVPGPPNDPAFVPPEVKGNDPKQGPFLGSILQGGGSTFIGPLMAHWSDIYQRKNSDIRIDYQGIGSGKGVQGILDGVFQFGCSDAPLSDARLAEASKRRGDVVHLPLVMGAVVPVYNLPELVEQLRITGPILADIYLGKIVRWDDPAIQVNNPGVKLPDLPITVIARADSSGTTYIFTDYLSKVSANWRDKFGAETTVAWPVGQSGARNQGVADLVSRTSGAIGYVELTYALESNLRYGLLKNREGKFVRPSLESVTAAAAASLQTIPNDLRYTLTDAPGADSYPIAGTAWAIVYVDQRNNSKARQLVAFLSWAVHDDQTYAKDLKYSPLPTELIKKIDDKLALIQLPKSD